MTKHTTFTIKQILKDHWVHFVTSNPNLKIRPIVFKEVNKVIYCGDFFHITLQFCVLIVYFLALNFLLVIKNEVNG